MAPAPFGLAQYPCLISPCVASSPSPRSPTKKAPTHGLGTGDTAVREGKGTNVSARLGPGGADRARVKWGAWGVQNKAARWERADSVASAGSHVKAVRAQPVRDRRSVKGSGQRKAPRQVWSGGVSAGPCGEGRLRGLGPQTRPRLLLRV